MSRPNQFSLLRQRRFAPFFATQFLGALNDNIFRNGLVILVTFQGVLVAGMNVSELANVAGALFILPFFLFSALFGQFADKFEKSVQIRRVKLFEVVIMALATLGYASIPRPPLNAAIALSILFLGPEIVRMWRGETSFTLRHPWVVAFAFGLLHGFGFAGALREIGLPTADIPAVLLLFNLGIEAGQIAFVLAILAIAADGVLEFQLRPEAQAVRELVAEEQHKAGKIDLLLTAVVGIEIFVVQLAISAELGSLCPAGCGRTAVAALLGQFHCRSNPADSSTYD